MQGYSKGIAALYDYYPSSAERTRSSSRYNGRTLRERGRRCATSGLCLHRKHQNITPRIPCGTIDERRKKHAGRSRHKRRITMAEGVEMA